LVAGGPFESPDAGDGGSAGRRGPLPGRRQRRLGQNFLADTNLLDAIVADAVGVDTSGAQNGPMLNVARCVPLIEKSGDNDAMEAEPVTVARPVATVRVTDGDTDTVAVRRTVTTVGDTDTVCE